MKSFRPRQVFLAASLAVLAGMFAFACGSNEDVPPTCEGAACIDGGGSESSTPEGSTADGPHGDAPSDARTDADAGACSLQESDAGDAGPSGTLQWALNFGVSGYTYPTTVARDPANGDIVVTGYFWGTTDFGGGPLTSVAADDGSDVFLTRFDKDGTYRWAGAWGNGSNLVANAVAVGPSGEMVFAGLLRTGSVDFGCGPLTAAGSPNLFVAKLAKTGACVWSKGFGVAGVTSLALDASANVVLAGGAAGADFGGGSLSGQYLAKLAPGGSHVWSRAFPAPTSYGGPWVALDPLGNSVFAGNTHAPSIDLGGGPRVSSNGDGGTQPSAAFIAKFDPAGKHLWSRRYAHFTTIKGAVATDRCGNATLHGDFFGVVDFGSGALTGTDGDNDYAFLAKLSADGNALWSKALVGTFTPGGANAFGLGGIAADPSGGVTIAPVLAGDDVNGKSTADFGGGPLTSFGRASVTIASFDQNGKHRWSFGGGAPSTATASFAALPSAAAAWGATVAVTGAFNKCAMVCDMAPPGTTLVLAGKTLTAASGQDLFIASFTP